jgi:ankyrin repeat protein
MELLLQDDFYAIDSEEFINALLDYNFANIKSMFQTSLVYTVFTWAAKLLHSDFF